MFLINAKEKYRTKCCKAKITTTKIKEKNTSREDVFYSCSSCGKEITRFHSKSIAPK